MKVIKLEVKNVKSFKDKTSIEFNKDFNVLIGPNGGGKSNILDIINIVLRHYFLISYKVVLTNNGFGEV
ncbi:AAA family ATPase [uncultured Nostoc sp.]|uniref:AAA family ATPase n=1 Tax=uncultured Nostoc sp. TaxID=340711 RepID=UPI0035C981A3